MEEAAATHTAHARALLLFGDASAALRETRAAEAILETASARELELFRTSVSNDIVLGHALAALDRLADAGERWSGAATRLEALPAHSQIEFNPLLAEAYFALGRTEEATRIARQLSAGGYVESLPVPS